MTPLKNLLNALHDTCKWALHICLIPVIAALKAISVGLEHITEALGKI